jgi:rubrerythrin
MTESAAIYQAGQVVKRWRCPMCTHILGDVVNGSCTVNHTIKVSEKDVPVLICPVCKTEIKLYCYAAAEGK